MTDPEEQPEQRPEPPRRRHRRRIGRGSVLAAVLLAALGFSLVVQVRQTHEGGLATLSQSELVQILGTVNNKSEQVEQETQELEQTAAELRSGTDQAALAERSTRQRLQVLGILAGTLPATGPGIQLVIEDGQGAVQASAVLNAVQELRDAGAEAMQINGTGGAVRIIASTAFTDPASPGQAGIEVSGVLMRSPYTITAIGQPETMSSALNIPGGVLDSLRQQGERGSVRSMQKLTVSALSQASSPTYATPGAG
jgi:uncharacterized protein YlxW (UPF0749 family)